MLAVARILRTGAKLLLLDEISEGLAPVIVQKLAEMVLALRRPGLHDRDGGAELPLRRAAGRPLPRDGARPVIQHSPRPSCRSRQRRCTNTSASDAVLPAHGDPHEAHEIAAACTLPRHARAAPPRPRSRAT
jgi:hypothetical protein